MDRIELEFVPMSNPQYVEIRDGHYVAQAMRAREDRKDRAYKVASHGQQLHFLVRYGGDLVGAISGGAAVFSVPARNQFFRFPKLQARYHRDCPERPCQHDHIQAIVDNTLFRLVTDDSVKNLGSATLRVWREASAILWREIYGVPVIGFETFVDGDAPEGVPRDGRMYKADNWIDLGRTDGRSKQHTKARGLAETREHVNTTKKLIYARWITPEPEKKTGRYYDEWLAKVTPEPYQSGWDHDKHTLECACHKCGGTEDTITYRHPDPAVRAAKKALKSRAGRAQFFGSKYWLEGRSLRTYLPERD